MLKVSVAELRAALAKTKELALDLQPEELELDNSELAVQGSIRCDGRIVNVGGQLLLEAKLRAKVKRTCARCLRDFVVESSCRVQEHYYPAAAAPRGESVLTYDSDVLDLTGPLREALLLAEPLRALCKEDCKGLCPKCGADLNVTACDCSRQSTDPRLAALAAFTDR